MVPESFLDLDHPPGKPRSTRLTHVLDKGMPTAFIKPLLETVGDFVDIWKLGWGTAYLEPNPAAKIELLAQHGVRACVGGTLLEVAWAQGKVPAFLEWAKREGFPCIEASNGAIEMPAASKRELISEASGAFEVLSEVGSKADDAEASANEWADEILSDLDAGARWVLTEGRESGTVGLFTPEGRVREDTVEELIELVPHPNIVFEAPRKEQQAWFVRRFGSNVNLGNVIVAEVLGLEALRLGLRADTIKLSLPTKED